MFNYNDWREAELARLDNEEGDLCQRLSAAERRNDGQDNALQAALQKVYDAQDSLNAGPKAKMQQQSQPRLPPRDWEGERRALRKELGIAEGEDDVVGVRFEKGALYSGSTYKKQQSYAPYREIPLPMRARILKVNTIGSDIYFRSERVVYNLFGCRHLERALRGVALPAEGTLVAVPAPHKGKPGRCELRFE